MLNVNRIYRCLEEEIIYFFGKSRAAIVLGINNIFQKCIMNNSNISSSHFQGRLKFLQVFRHAVKKPQNTYTTHLGSSKVSVSSQSQAKKESRV